MTPEQLDAIELQARYLGGDCAETVLALVAEVRRLREEHAAPTYDLVGWHRVEPDTGGVSWRNTEPAPDNTQWEPVYRRRTDG